MVSKKRRLILKKKEQAFQLIATHLNEFKGPGHHGDEHVEQDDDAAPVVSTKDPVAHVLGENVFKLV